MNLLRFVVLVGVLVFVHELGHFLAARVSGVKVLQFSLGFGPRIFGFRLGGTEYRVGILPLGGFVKMLGEDHDDSVSASDKGKAFVSQSLGKRALIVLAGPLLSLLFPLFLYFVLFLGQSTLTPPVIGTVVAGLPADGKLLPNDRILSINGQEIFSFQQVREVIAESPAISLRFRVKRGDSEQTVSITPQSVKIEQPLDVIEYGGRVGITASFPLAVIAVRHGRSPAAQAGLRTFDIVTSYAGRPVRRWSELERLLGLSRGSTVPVSYLRPSPVNAALNGLCDLAVLEPSLAMVTSEPGEGDVLSRTGIEVPDLYVADVPSDSPEYAMGLRRGDKILGVDGITPASWEAVREALFDNPTRQHTLSFQHEGREVVGAFVLDREEITDEFGQRFRRPAFRSTHWVPAVSEPPIDNPNPIRWAFRNAVIETGRALSFLSLSIVRVIQGRLPASSVGGPLAIYDATRSTATDGSAGFLRLMALISINLGLLNLLPIPTLDGGHLMFYLYELVRRKPLALRARRLASLAGLVMLLSLMAFAIKNDLQRKLTRGNDVIDVR